MIKSIKTYQLKLNILIKNLIYLIILIPFFSASQAQSVSLLSSSTKSSFRGLSVVDNNTIWVSGSNGTIGKSIDAGSTWKFITIKGFEKIDFRDIEAFDDMTAIVMGTDVPAYILKTIDGGTSWDIVFKDTSKGMFLDAMEFWNEQSGIVIGDPIDGRFFIARTFDGGKNWTPIPFQNRPLADSGEACFASSGTNIRKLNKEEAIFISGGLHSNFFIKDKKINAGIIQGTESTGANSLAIKNSYNFIIVGGDFNKKDETTKNCVITNDGGKTWISPKTKPSGYRSCIEYLNKKNWITCGLNGVDYSNDEGLHFKKISDTGFHVCRKAKKGNAVFFAGGGGRIGKLIK